MIHSIGIIGSGNVAWHLAHGFQTSTKVQVSWIYGRNKSSLDEFQNLTDVSSFTTLPSTKVDLILVCVNDDAIQSVLNQLPTDCKVAYTSGVVNLDSLVHSELNCGVFYPLQTFTKGKSIDLKNVPFLIEAHDPAFAVELKQLAAELSNNVQSMDSAQRKQLHIAAVFTNNFVNHLLFLAQKQLKEQSIDQDILTPLLLETINKYIAIGPYDAQSGPARRKDMQAIEEHKKELKGIDKEIYTLITDSILNTYKK